MGSAPISVEEFKIKYKNDSLKLLQQSSQIVNTLADRTGVEPRSPYCLITLLPVRNVGLPYRTSTRKDGQEYETVIQTKELQA